MTKSESLIDDTDELSIESLAACAVIPSAGMTKASTLLRSALGTFGDLQRRAKHVYAVADDLVDTARWCFRVRRFAKAKYPCYMYA